MSKYGEFQTSLKDERLLLAALREMGLEPEVNPTGIEIKATHGRARRAEIVVRREKVGAIWADVGFAKGEDGTYAAIIDNMDYTVRTTWLNQVKQGYAEQRTLAMAKAKGYVFQGREVTQTAKGQQVRLLFAAR